MASLTFYLRPSRGGGFTNALCLRFIHRRQVKTLSSPYRLLREQWDDTLQQVRRGKTESEANGYLKEASDYISDARQKFGVCLDELNQESECRIDDIVESFRLLTRSDLLSVYCEKLARQLRRNNQERTARAYLTIAKGVQRFHKKDIPLDGIHAVFVKSFEQYLKEEGKAQNTISFYMRNLRAVYHRAIEDNIIRPKTSPPFKNVYTGVEHTRKRALDKSELNRLNNLDLLAEHKGKTDKKNPKHSPTSPQDAGLSRSLRFFFFCLHAQGMSFVDMAYLQKSNISGGLLRYYRKKTRQTVEITLSESMRGIIRSFGDETKDSPYLFPIISHPQKNARLQYESALRLHNKRLKTLAQMAGIHKNLSSHVARHSWATIAKREELPLAVISEGLGHSNEKTTHIYLASFEHSVLEKANKKIASVIQYPQNITGQSGKPQPRQDKAAFATCG